MKNIKIYFIYILFIFIYIYKSIHSQVCSTASTSKTWEAIDDLGLRFVSRDSHAAVAFNDSIWVMGGHTAEYLSKDLTSTFARNDIWYSNDGANWTNIIKEAPWPRRYGHTLTVFNEYMVLIGGFTPEPSNDVWISKNGYDWNEITSTSIFSGRSWHCSVVFNKKIYVMGGNPINNEIWSIEDIATGKWTRRENGPWNGRLGHGCVSHNRTTNSSLGDLSKQSFLYLIGGWNGKSHNDVWRMDTNEKWILLVQSAPWEPRAWMGAIAFDSKAHYDIINGPRLWIIGGGTIGNGVLKMTGYADTWYSWDGVDWVKTSSDKSGVSSANWCMIHYKNKWQCFGKWGQTVIQFKKPIKRAFICNSGCITEDKLYNLSGKIIPLCDPINKLPSAPILGTIQIGNSVRSKTLYPDTCDLCTSGITRYQNITSLPALYFIAGDVAGAFSTKDVFVSQDTFLCEKDGVLCDSKGSCTIGGSCICSKGKTGLFCTENDPVIVIQSDASCFSEESTVITLFGKKKLSDTLFGDKVLSYDMNKKIIVYSDVYYLPTTVPSSKSILFLQIFYLSSKNNMVQVLQVTPSHLLYANINDEIIKISASKLDANMKIGILDGNYSYTYYTWSRIKEIKKTTKYGAYNIYTLSGNMFVDGVLCSNFGDFYPKLNTFLERNPDYLPYLYFLPLRILYKLYPSYVLHQVAKYVNDYLLLPSIRLFFYHKTI